jgi:hypothetical protein
MLAGFYGGNTMQRVALLLDAPRRLERYFKRERRERSQDDLFALWPLRMIIVAAGLVLGVLGCGFDAPSEKAAVITGDTLVSSRSATGIIGPSVDVLTSFALDYMYNRMVSADAIAEWYFVDAVFAPFSYDGRLYPPEDTRSWVEPVEPLSQTTREKLEGMGFTVCNLGEDTHTYCDEVAKVGVHDHVFLGLGEPQRLSEYRWSFDVGFGVMARSGVSIGGARIVIQSHQGAWSLSDARTLWVDH